MVLLYNPMWKKEYAPNRWRERVALNSFKLQIKQTQVITEI